MDFEIAISFAYTLKSEKHYWNCSLGLGDKSTANLRDNGDLASCFNFGQHSDMSDVSNICQFIKSQGKPLDIVCLIFLVVRVSPSFLTSLRNLLPKGQFS